MGPYKNFDECLVAQKAKGHDADSSRRICGKIYQQTEGKKKHAGKNKK